MFPTSTGVPFERYRRRSRNPLMAYVVVVVVVHRNGTAHRQQNTWLACLQCPLPRQSMTMRRFAFQFMALRAIPRLVCVFSTCEATRQHGPELPSKCDLVVPTPSYQGCNTQPNSPGACVG